MLLIKCIEHLQDCRRLAGEMGQKTVESLERCVYRYADDEDKLVVLHQERKQPYSFYFTISTLKDGKWDYWYNGGIIYSGHSKTYGIHT